MLTIVQIMDRLLQDYFTPEDIAEYKKLLEKNSASKKPFKTSLNKPTQNQLDSKIAPTQNYHSSMNFLISYAEKKLKGHKLVEFIEYLGDISISQGELGTAEEIYMHVLNMIKDDAQYRTVAAYSYLALGDIFSRQAAWEKSIEAVYKAKKLFRQLKDNKGMFKCENLLGTIAGDRGDLNGSNKHFEKAFSYLRSKKDAPLVGMLEVNLGIVNSIKGNYDAAFTFYQRALIKFEQIQDFRRITEVRHNLGMMMTERGEYRAALSEFDLSIDSALKAGYLPTLSLSYLGKAFIYTQLEDYPLASAFADKAMEICFKLNDRLSIADIYKIKGVIERRVKNYKGAENYLLSSLRINEELENVLNEAESSYELGVLYAEQGRKEEARKYLQSAFDYYKKQDAIAMVRRIQELLHVVTKK